MNDGIFIAICIIVYLLIGVLATVVFLNRHQADQLEDLAPVFVLVWPAIFVHWLLLLIYWAIDTTDRLIFGRRVKR